MHDLTRHLAAARGRYDTAREGRNIAYGSSSGLDPKARREAAKRDDANWEVLARIAAATDPTDEPSLVKAIDEFNALGNMYNLKDGFFSALRDKVPFAARGQYVRNIASLEHLYFYWKFAELKDAREAWGGSSVALASVYSYKDLLLAVIMEKDDSHVLIRHFAVNVLLACIDRGKLTLDAGTIMTLRNADKSPHPRLRKKARNGGGFYHGRPKSMPEPSFHFQLEYDFNKHDVDSLGRVFGKGCWEVDDLISGIVQKIDPSMTHMYEDGGREPRGRGSHEMTTRFHSYGQQLGWHALFIAAGKLLAAHPVTDDWWYEDDPWGEWFGRYVLTRKDGMWLSDGTDRTPDDASVKLLEMKKNGLAITGDQKKIMGLAGLDIDKGVGRELIVQGRWYSSDGVEIGLSSALVPPQKAAQFARKVIREKPIVAWVPAFQGGEYDDEYLRSDKKEYSPWIVCPSGEPRLDEHDPYGVSVANLRPRLAQDYLEFCKLTRQDAFGGCSSTSAL